MASLAEREGLRGKVQCIYFDPPYGIKFNSNFQWSTTSRDVKDGNAGHITREPEQVKAFRDTWRDGIHSYLTYLRDRLTVARDLLTDSGSIFVQIGDENVHRVRALMDEVFGEDNFICDQSHLENDGWAQAESLVTGLRLHALVCKGRDERSKYRQTSMSRATRKRWTVALLDRSSFANGESASRLIAESERSDSALPDRLAIFTDIC
ncbi:MAG: DNA methyltransferase [Giesbergeria sp.]